MMTKYILLSEKSWHKDLYQSLQKLTNTTWKLIDKKDAFSVEHVRSFQPHKIFIPHWSYKIPADIYEAYECIVFHMTDLPYGRGGSPLQNLIKAGHTETMISALRVEAGMDTGPIYLKKPLSLYGTAQEIFLRSSKQILEMILEIHTQQPIPVKQSGDVVVFKRRTPDQSNIADVSDIQELYDHIRMLDCEGYPPAFIETDHFRFEFTRPTFKNTQNLIADVRIIKK